MAFGKGNVSNSQQAEYPKYTGITPCSLVALNPDRSTLEEMGISVYEDPMYIKTREIDGQNVREALVTIYLKPEGKIRGKNVNIRPIRLTFSILDKLFYNKDQTKVQIIDKYGNTAWATVEEYKEKKIPVYKNGQSANIDKDYHAAYMGEAMLIKFIKAFLDLDDWKIYSNEQQCYVEHPNLSLCEASLDNINNLFQGDFSEIAYCLGSQPNNYVKCLLGVRYSVEGNCYQTIFPYHFMKNRARKIDDFNKELNSIVERGGEQHSDYIVGELQEFNTTPTNIQENIDTTNTPPVQNSVPSYAPADDLPF